MISSISGFKDDPRVFQISVPLQPGNSGGPLLLRSGQVIGITTSSLDDLTMLMESGTLPQNVNYAVKINYAKLLIDSSGILLDSPEFQGEEAFIQIVDLVAKAIVVVVSE